MEGIFSHVLFMLSKENCSRYDSGLGGRKSDMILSAPHYLHKYFMHKMTSEIGVISKTLSSILIT